jgi:hypothetical protein
LIRLSFGFDTEHSDPLRCANQRADVCGVLDQIVLPAHIDSQIAPIVAITSDLALLQTNLTDRTMA